MHKLWKALITAAILVLLYLPGSPISERSLSKIPWAILFILALTNGISLFFATKLPLYRRWGTAYLALMGLVYLLTGVFGFLRNAGLIVASMWYSQISPGPLVAVLQGVMHPRSFDIYKLDYWIFQNSDSGLTRLSIFAIFVGLVAVIAAFSMAKNKKIAFHVWLALAALFILEALGYVVAQFGKWGMPQYLGPNDRTDTIVALCWAASYLAAYLMARIGVDFRKRSAAGDGASPKQ
jgi:hypothetical protein